jgi:hypothetical protein
MTRPVRPCSAGASEYATLGWNVAGIVVLAIAAISARSVALAGFGLDSLIEIGASAVVIWELSGTGEARQRRALRLIGAGFALLAVYLLVQSTVVLVTGFRPHHSPLGIGWTAVTVAVMLALAGGRPTRRLATCSCTTPPARSGRSSPAATDRRRGPSPNQSGRRIKGPAPAPVSLPRPALAALAGSEREYIRDRAPWKATSRPAPGASRSAARSSPPKRCSASPCT